MRPYGILGIITQNLIYTGDLKSLLKSAMRLSSLMMLIIIILYVHVNKYIIV